MCRLQSVTSLLKEMQQHCIKVYTRLIYMYSIMMVILLTVITSLKKKISKSKQKTYNYQGSMSRRCSEKKKETIKLTPLSQAKLSLHNAKSHF